jgi:hypothetical protein
MISKQDEIEKKKKNIDIKETDIKNEKIKEVNKIEEKKNINSNLLKIPTVKDKINSILLKITKNENIDKLPKTEFFEWNLVNIGEDIADFIFYDFNNENILKIAIFYNTKDENCKKKLIKKKI